MWGMMKVEVLMMIMMMMICASKGWRTDEESLLVWSLKISSPGMVVLLDKTIEIDQPLLVPEGVVLKGTDTGQLIASQTFPSKVAMIVLSSNSALDGVTASGASIAWLIVSCISNATNITIQNCDLSETNNQIGTPAPEGYYHVDIVKAMSVKGLRILNNRLTYAGFNATGRYLPTEWA